MSNPAQEEVDRMFSDKTHHTSHPEDRDVRDLDASDQETFGTRRTIRGGQAKRNQDESNSDSDEQDNATTTTGSKSTYKVPSTVSYANTGPKGVIADAQSYHRSKRNAVQQQSSHATPISISNNITTKQTQLKSDSDSDSDLDLSDPDNDDFMETWRQRRLQELHDASSTASTVHRTSPSTRTYGRLDTVDATGYLDAIEHSAPGSVVVVLIYDTDAQSRSVSEELERIAYTWSHVRFVKLDADIAEMQELEIPAVLAYRDADVFATVSGAKADGLEEVLKRHGVLSR